MRILCIGDCHIPNNKSIGITPSEEITECINLFKMIEEILDKNSDIEMILFLGDIFDTPDKGNTEMNSLIMELFRRLSTYNRNIIIISGNHDCDSTNQIETNGIKYYNSQLNLLTNYATIIFEPTICDIEGNQVVLMPYRTNTKEVFNNLKLDKNKNKICFTHIDINGIDSYQELIEDHNMISIQELCDLGFSTVISGHIHNNIERVVSTDGGINVCLLTYLGSSRNINFNNTNTYAQIAVVNIDNNGLVWEHKVINPYTFIYKTFDNIDSINKYINMNNEEILSKTKIKYKYKTEDELKYINTIKNKFKSFKLEKNLDSIITNNGDIINKEDIEELGSLLQNNIVSSENIKDYCYRFSPIEDTTNTDQVMEIIKKVDK